MRWQTIAYFGSLCGVALLAWLLLLPPALLASYVSQATAGRLVVLATSGTLWKGQAWYGVSDGLHVWAIPHAFQWSVVYNERNMPFGLRIEHPNLITPLHAGWDKQSFLIHAGQLQFPAQWLSSLGAPLNTIAPEGILTVRWQNLRPQAPIDVQASWNDAQSALASIRPLGQYHLHLQGHWNAPFTLTLTTQEGPLFMEGTGTLAPNQRLQFQGQAYAAPNSKAALTGLLSQMGRLDGGRYRLGVF